MAGMGPPDPIWPSGWGTETIAGLVGAIQDRAAVQDNGGLH